MIYQWDEPRRVYETYVQPLPRAGTYDPPTLLVELILDGYAKSPGNSAIMLARSVLLEAEESIGVAEEGIADDQFLWSFVALRHAILVNPELLVRYRQWPDSVCAKAFAAGMHWPSRKRRLLGLLDHVENQYFGANKLGRHRQYLLN